MSGSIQPAETFFLRRGECPDCRDSLEHREYGIEDDYGKVTAVTIEYCNSCDESKDITVSYYSSRENE